VALVHDLPREKDVRVVVVGVDDDMPLGEEICRRVGDRRCISLAGRFSFQELLTLLAMARLLISHDSGPPHFAARTDTATIVLFSPETPTLYRPLGARVTVLYRHLACSPCVSAFNHRGSLCTDNRCLKAITPEEVAAEARRLLSL